MTPPPTTKFISEYTKGWLGWIKTPFSAQANIDIPNHVIRFHSEPDGSLMIGKKVENLREYAKATLELDALFARIEDNCERLEFDIPSVAEWLEEMPAFPRLSSKERELMEAAIRKAMDIAIHNILASRQNTGKQL